MLHRKSSRTLPVFIDVYRIGTNTTQTRTREIVNTKYCGAQHTHNIKHRRYFYWKVFCTTIRFLFTRRPADGLIVTGFSSTIMCVCVCTRSLWFPIDDVSHTVVCIAKFTHCLLTMVKWWVTRSLNCPYSQEWVDCMGTDAVSFFALKKSKKVGCMHLHHHRDSLVRFVIELHYGGGD